MKLSKLKIGGFFLALAVLGWFLYPRQLFLGYLYEGTTDLMKAEAYYITYLENRPYNKFAVLKLASLYERMAQPEKALPYLDHLLQRRPSDWSLIEYYLEYLTNLHDNEALYRSRLSLADVLMNYPRVPREKVENILWDAFVYARWNQYSQEAHDILIKLIQVSKKPSDYEDTLLELKLSLNRVAEAAEALETKLSQDPKSEDLRLQLAGIYSVIKDYPKALRVVEEGLKYWPRSEGLWVTLSNIHEDQGQRQQFLEDLIQMKHLAKTGTPFWTETLLRLADYYLDEQQGSKAIDLYQQLLGFDQDNRQGWLNLANLYSELEMGPEALTTLAQYEEKFGADSSSLSLKATVSLYLMQNPYAVNLYRAYLSESQSLLFGQEVANLLLTHKMYSEAILWLHNLNSLFSGNRDNLKMLAEAYLQNGQAYKALALYEELGVAQSKDVSLLFQLAWLYAQEGRLKEAEGIFLRIGSLKERDASFLTQVGRELLFLGNAKKSREFFETSLKLNPRQAEAWFWLAEAYYSDLKKEEALQAYASVVPLLENKHRTQAQHQMYLKSRGRMDLNPQMIDLYEQALRQYPADRDLRTDYLDLLIEAHQHDRVTKIFSQFVKDFPLETDRLWPYQVRLAFDQKNFKQALYYLDRILKTNPNQWAYRRDRAECLYRLGKWREARKEYETLFKVTQNDLGIAPFLDDIHRRYDHRLKQQMGFQHLGEDQILWLASSYQGYVHEHLKLSGSFRWGFYDLDRLSINEQTYTGEAALMWDQTFWQTRLGLLFGFSDKRQTPGVELGFSYEKPDVWNVDLDFSWRKLRLDSSPVVNAGDLQDTFEIKAQWTPLDRLLVSSRYELNRDVLSQDEVGWIHTFEPVISYRLLNVPELTVGYQLTFSHIQSSDNFLTQTSLIPDMQAHYLVMNTAYRPRKNILVEAGLFMGEDPQRDLHFFEADLLGARAGIYWALSSWLDLETTYDFGKETQAGNTGVSHQFYWGLSGHWH